MKKVFPIILLSLTLLTACNSNAPKATSSDSTVEKSTVTNTTQSNRPTESSSLPEATFVYTFDPNRPIFVNVDGTYMESNSTAFTITTMEAITNNECRKQLQDFYNNGRDMIYEEGENATTPTGYILIYNGGDLQEKFFVGTENINLDQGFAAYQKYLEHEKNEKAITW